MIDMPTYIDFTSNITTLRARRSQLHYTLTANRPTKIKLARAALNFPFDAVINGHTVISGECLPCEVIVNEHGGVIVVEE